MSKKIRVKDLTLISLVIVIMTTACVSTHPVTKENAVTPSESTFFSTVSIEDHSTYNSDSDGDLWPTAWAEDDNLYSANGDGKGFGLAFSDITINKITGSPDNTIAGSILTTDISQTWSGSGYNRKPTGMACVDGILYCAIQDLAKNFDDVPAATICKSTDHGATWTWDTSAPMFKEHIFTTVIFLDYGKNYINCPDDYIYAYGMDNNWRDSFSNSTTDPTRLYIARVPKDQIMKRPSWQFYTGKDVDGKPMWSLDINSRKPVLQDERRIYTNMNNYDTNPKNMTVISQGSIVYDKPLNRYLYLSWTEYTYEFYEAPSPWGPWKKFYTKDFGIYPWNHLKNGGYATVAPSKYISADGKTLWVQSNTWTSGQKNYNFSLRKLTLEPYISTNLSNEKNDKNLALLPNGAGVTPIYKSTHFAHGDYLNDEELNQTENSWDGEAKTADWWGYTWKQAYNINKMVYTTGKMSSDGGWFNDIKVQVRQNFNWVDTKGLKVSPVYPNNNTAGQNVSYTFKFNDIWGDGIRIIGKPGGKAHFTSIAELEVYFR